MHCNAFTPSRAIRPSHPPPRTMFLLSALKSAAVICANSFVAKVYVTARFRYLLANTIKGNLWKKAYRLPDTSEIKELQDGHLKQDQTWKRVRATQLNEVEWTSICLPLCLYFASKSSGDDLACSIMAWTQVGYTVARGLLGYPYQMPFAVLRFVALGLGVKNLWDMAF